MHDLDRQLAEVRTAVQVRWTEERARRVERSFQRRRQRRKVLHAAAGVAAVLVLLFALRGFFGSGDPRSVALHRAKPAPEGTAIPPHSASPKGRDALHLSDGSVVHLLSPASRIVLMSAPLSDAPMSTSIEIQSGGARFQVTHDPSRVFRVQAGAVTAEVLGTEFTVERIGERARVSVEHGRVRVLWPRGRTELGAGQSGIFPPEAAPDLGVAAEVDRTPQPSHPAVRLPTRAPPQPPQPPEPRKDDARSEPAKRAPEPTPAPGASWLALAQEGRFDSAYEALVQRGLDAVRGPAELLLAADVARLSRHPAEAVAPLRRLLREHPQDPRAPLAAFTLGRGLLDELGRPREAAVAFRTAQDLEPEGPLTADALAREVEAWSRAGETQRARERALLYLQRYPEGDRRRSVQRYGGVE